VREAHNPRDERHAVCVDLRSLTAPLVEHAIELILPVSLPRFPGLSHLTIYLLIKYLDIKVVQA
jgi:hypothetical protein